MIEIIIISNLINALSSLNILKYIPGRVEDLANWIHVQGVKSI